jgi:hypothetical protein
MSAENKKRAIAFAITFVAVIAGIAAYKKYEERQEQKALEDAKKSTVVEA